MSQPVTDNLNSAALIARLTEECGRLDLPERLMTARHAIGGRVVFTTSFGIEDQAIAHTISRPGVKIVWIPPDFPVAPGFPEGNYLKLAIAIRA